MALNSADTRQGFPFPYDEVFTGLVAVLPAAGYGVKSQDRLIGRIRSGAGASAFSWGEDIVIQVARTSETVTDVVIQSNLKVGFNFTGSSKNAQNAERIIGALSHYLKHGSRDPQKSAAAAPSVQAPLPLWLIALAIALAALLPMLLQAQTPSGARPGPRDPTTAVALSFFVPGAGQVYANATGLGVGFLAAATAGAVLLAKGMGEEASCPEQSSYSFTGCSRTSSSAKQGVGLALLVGSWLSSMLEAPGSVRRYNRDHGLTPIVRSGAGETVRVGASISVR